VGARNRTAGPTPRAGGARAAPLSKLLADGALIALLVLAGLVGSLTAYRSLTLRAASQQRELLQALGQSVVGAFERQMVRAVEALQVSALMWSAQGGAPTRRQFLRHGASLLDESASLTLLEWQPVVPAARLQAFERHAALEQPGYHVVEPAADGKGFVPAAARALHVPVLYSWPEQGAALGVDMAFDERRMHSKWLARDTGAPVASETFDLIRRGQDGPAASGFAVSAPVYRSVGPSDTQRRREELVGFLAGVIQVSELMRDATARAEANDLDLLVFDQAAPRRLIQASAGADAAADMPAEAVLNVDVGGRIWQIELRPRAGAQGARADALPLAVLAAGIAATLVSALAVARSLVIRRRLERAEAGLAEDRLRLTNVLDGTAAGTWDWHLGEDRLVINERWAQMIGRRPEALEPVTGSTWMALCHAGDLVAAQAALARHLRGEDDRYAVEFRMRHADGHWVWIESIGRIFERDADGRPLRMAGTHMDISRRKADEQRLLDDARALEAANRQLRDLAIVDALTGAFNRRHFADVCHAALASAQRGEALALCMLDIDHFKAYNDHYGHQAGDAVLRAVAQTLKDGLKRSTDALFRLGGEEFGIIFSAASPQAAQLFVGQLAAGLHALALPHAQSPLRIVTASFGLAWWAAPTPGLTPEAMYAQADAALYDAKLSGRDQIAVRCFASGDGEAGQPQA
jgi:diguanylate cyclase (GGDEF)-like protein/PAS domain S-box-containing protein